MSTEKEGGEFLHNKYPTLHTEAPVEYTQERYRFEGRDTSQNPSSKINDWLEVIERTHTSHRNNPEVMDRIRGYYHDKYVIKEENIPQSYWNSLANFAIKEGRGRDLEISGVRKEIVKDNNGKEITNYLFPEDLKKEHSESLIDDQKTTLNNWINYLTSADSDIYPTWAKYWAFNGMVKLSQYDKEKKVFGKRDKNTVAPFADLNREALAYVVDAVVKVARKENIPDQENNPEFKELLQGTNFGKLYSYAIEKVTPTEQNKLKETRGEWIKYKRGSDHMSLVNSIQGYGTGWCTAGESVAQKQLSGGDFYVYYSLDDTGKPTIPRVAIRMTDNKIAEVRGIAQSQNLDPYINEIVDKKLEEFPDGQNYKKRLEDMKLLTLINEKVAKGESLNREDLRFLYEIDSKIEGFGYNRDPRIENILSGRDVKSDIASVLGCRRDEVSVTKKEALKEGIKYHYGHLDLSDLTSAEGLNLPESVGGSVYLRSLTSAEGLHLPKSVGGDINLRNLISAEGLNLPESVGGSVYLGSLRSAEGLHLPKSVGVSIDLDNLTSAKGLDFPEIVGGTIYLSSLRSAEGLNLPELVGESVYLRSLTSAEGLHLPRSVGVNIDLDSLTSAEGLHLPKFVGGGIDLDSLTSAKGLNLPESVGGSVYLSSLTSTEWLNLPKSVGGGIYLGNLRSAKGLNLPESVGGSIYLHNLTSTEGLHLPKYVGGDIDLDNLTSDKGLDFPEIVGESIYLGNLRSTKGLNLPESVGGSIYLHNLTSTEGLHLPKYVGGDIDLDNLRSVKGLDLPETVGGSVYLGSLRSAKGLNLPKSVGVNIDLDNLTSAKGLNFPESVGGSVYLRSLTSAEWLNLPKSVGVDINLRNLISAEGLNLPESVGGSVYLGSLRSAKGLNLPKFVDGSIYLDRLPLAEKESLRTHHPDFHII